MIIMGNKNNEDIAKPFVKWVGGKSQLIKIFDSKFPREIREIKKYFEPFIGGGALFFFFFFNYDNIAKAYISDTNEDLILTYRVIKESHEDLILKLDGLIDEWPDTHNSRRPIYERIREEFNKTKSIIDYNRNKNFDEVDILQAARLIFLNKTCFNGIYRVNSKGEFNVPYGGIAYNSKFMDKKLTYYRSSLCSITLQILTSIILILRISCVKLNQMSRTLFFLIPHTILNSAPMHKMRLRKKIKNDLLIT